MTTPRILVVNAGSSSVKFAAFGAADMRELARGKLEHAGAPDEVLARLDRFL